MKNGKKLGMIIGIVIVLALGFGGWYGLKMKAVFDEMTPVSTQELADGVFVIQDAFTNMYLLKNGENYVAIDAASRINTVKQEMDKLGIDPYNVNAVFLTHTDGDHVGAVKLFKDATVYISAAEEQMIDGRTARAAGFIKNKLDVRYQTLEDGQMIELADLRVKAILTPGHTPGSMAYIVNQRYLFTGDALGLRNQRAGLFNRFFSMDSVMQGESIRKLAKLKGIEAMFTAHYGYTRRFREAFIDW